MDLQISPAQHADAGELITVQRAAFLAEGRLNDSFLLPPLTETLDEVRAAIASDDTVVLVARLGHRLIGSVRGLIADGTGHVGRLAVAPDLQGHGIGRQLMTAIEAELTGRVTRFELFTGATSEGNLRLYRSLGYVEIGQRSAPQGPGFSARAGGTPAGGSTAPVAAPPLAFLEKRA
jgi:ribosomal protein S18 acetylase RimI-like enzyme